MSKNKRQDDFESQLKSEPAVYDQAAYTIVKVADNQFQLVEIKLDKKTLEVGSSEVIDTVNTKYEAIEKFKIKVAKSGIL